MTTPAIEVKGLRKTYRSPLKQVRIDAVRDATFTVKPGEVFGFIGPNGAGKTTTIRVLVGLVKASAGVARMFGHDVPSRTARQRLGFLPEAPYFYDYLTAFELLDLTGRLCGVDKKVRRSRAEELVELVGLNHARHTQLKKYSKGMLQRAGIAQALINDPDLVILDEPMSGLDPVGRKDVRDIIHSLGERGKTVFFSSHILADVEMICDHVAFIVNGEMRGTGRLSELMRADLGTDVSLRLPETNTEAIGRKLSAEADRARVSNRELSVSLGISIDVDDYLAEARELGANVISVSPRHETLEDLFLQRALRGAESEPTAPPPAPGGGGGDGSDGEDEDES